MSLIKDLEKLFKAPVEVQPDTSYPNEAESGYYDDTSIAKYELPPTAVLDDKWAPTADKVVPGYRGVENHGVPFDSSDQYIVPMDQATADMHEAAMKEAASSVEYAKETIVEPIPVTVVDMPEPAARQVKLGVTQYTIQPGVVQRIAPQSHRRTLLKITTIGAAGTYGFVHPDMQAVQTIGFPVTGGEYLDLTTTQEVYGFVPTGGAATTFCILEETVSFTHEHTV